MEQGAPAPRHLHFEDRSTTVTGSRCSSREEARRRDLAAVLTRRAEASSPPIHMCDALPRNIRPELQTILADNPAHGGACS